jgi:hypothetical protein
MLSLMENELSRFVSPAQFLFLRLKKLSIWWSLVVAAAADRTGLRLLEVALVVVVPVALKRTSAVILLLCQVFMR